MKGLGFGKPKPERRVVDNRDYDYSPEREFAQTRHKSPSAIINKGGSRETFTIKETAGPGQYDDGIRFNSNTKTFTIGEKRQERVVESMGPGTYDPDRADGITKAKMPNINMGSSPSRGSFIKKDDANLGPG